jgi:hypothetical protein
MLPDFKFEAANDGLPWLFEKLRETVFHTDRVYLDPHFTSEQAAERYIGWIRDAHNKGMLVYFLTYKGTPVGFSQHGPKEDGHFEGTLMGSFKNNNCPAAGVLNTYLTIEQAVKSDTKYATAAVSTNNPRAIKVCLMLGYEHVKTEYVFVKHK